MSQSLLFQTDTENLNMELILASTSRYRAQLLSKLNLPFRQIASAVEEDEIAGESPESRARRLSEKKAQAVAQTLNTPALVIGSDQVAHCRSRVLNKPGNFENACEQLRFLSGQTATFSTGLALLNSQTFQCHTTCIDTDVHFRSLSDADIESYVRTDQPYDCAGSFKSEGFGITLIRSMHTEDPNSLVGLPLIALIDFLRAEAMNPLSVFTPTNDN